MRNLIILLVFLCLSCNQQAQEDSNNKNPVGTNNQNILYASESAMEKVPDVVNIDSVADIPKGTNELTPQFIKQRLQALVGNFLKEKCTKNGISYPPKFILFRFFKYEKEFEVWAGNSQKDSLRRILLLGVCAVDTEPGTKLQQGDGKTPEGFYNSAIQYGSSNYFMWIKLNHSEIDKDGEVNDGSSFKMCLDYPNALDRQRTKTLLKTKSPGSAICIHGNCVTAGCISFVNRDFLPVFLTALSHDSKSFGPIKIHIFPFRFNSITETDKEVFSENFGSMKKEQVLETWKNLEEAYDLFNKSRKALKINIVDNKKYSFSSY